MTIEEFVHNADGTMVSKDPWVHYSTVGNKVRMVDSKGAAKVSCYVPDGTIGEITEQVARYNKETDCREREEVHVEWPKQMYKPNVEYEDENEYGGVYYCHVDCVEPVL